MNGSTRRVAVLGGAGLGVGLLSSTRRIRALDQRVFRAVNRGHGRAPDAFFAALTELGSLYASGAAAAALALGGERRAAARALGAALTMWGLGQGLKQLFWRARPYDALPDVVRLLIARPQGTSWPSSHPAVLFSFLTVAARELNLGAAARAVTKGLAGGVAASRVYLGVHYPSDVAGGLLLGRAVGLAWSPDPAPAPSGS